MDSLQMVLVNVAFVIPGFIASSTYGRLVPQKKHGGQAALLRFLTLTAVIYAFWSWLLYLVYSFPDWWRMHPGWTVATIVAIMFVSPLVLGASWARLEQSSKVHAILLWFGFRSISPIPTAWDYFFSKSQPVWILVTMRDGSKVGGYWGGESFAAADEDGRDMYLQAVYRISPGKWQEGSKNKGMWIPGSEIRFLEFWPVS